MSERDEVIIATSGISENPFENAVTPVKVDWFNLEDFEKGVVPFAPFDIV